ncbi:transcriptional regulator [Verrucomicrobia bacterium LW23]|nr:transcriptional regulator [Verrucomicrobia bacterium LW23]
MPELNAALPALLVVEDEKNTRDGLRRALEDKFDVYLATDVEAAMNVLETEPIDVCLSDLRLGGGANGMELLARAQTLPRPPVFLMMTAYGSEAVAVEAMRRGAYHYVSKPLNLEELELTLLRAVRSRQVEVENRKLREELDSKFGLENLIGNTPAMTRLFDLIKQVANTSVTVMIEGESGTGKELVAKALHQLSSRRNNPYVAVHCAGLAPSLLESELFGHERGAFTGANTRRVGRFEEAGHGSIFLDEIGEIDASTQVKLLRVLGERYIQRVGGSANIPVHARIIAATNKDLKEMVKQGTFRDDLYFRLNVVSITMPVLRERRDDIPLLINAFLKEFAKQNNKNIAGFSQEALDAILRYEWPGNVRELRSAIEGAVALARTDRIGLKDLPFAVQSPLAGAIQVPGFGGIGPGARGTSSAAAAGPGMGMGAGSASAAATAPSQDIAGAASQGYTAPRLAGGGTAGALVVTGAAADALAEGAQDLNLEHMEKAFIVEALRRAGSNRTEAARLLGISRRTLHRKIHELHLEDS